MLFSGVNIDPAWATVDTYAFARTEWGSEIGCVMRLRNVFRRATAVRPAHHTRFRRARGIGEHAHSAAMQSPFSLPSILIRCVALPALNLSINISPLCAYFISLPTNLVLLQMFHLCFSLGCNATLPIDRPSLTDLQVASLLWRFGLLRNTILVCQMQLHSERSVSLIG